MTGFTLCLHTGRPVPFFSEIMTGFMVHLRPTGDARATITRGMRIAGPKGTRISPPMNDQTEQATGAAARQADRGRTASDRATPESIKHPRPRTTPRSTLLASCVCAVLAGGPAAALELGEPVVRSGLGQPLEVVVPYTTWGNERLTAECVSLVRGDAGGLPAVTAGRVSSTAGNRLVIRSDRGIREPLLGLNLKVDCPATPFIVRSYTLIIDPPGLAPAEAPAPLPAPRREPAEPAAVLPSAASAPRASRAPAPAQPLGQGSEYRVRVGDTLSTIAQRVSDRPTGIWATAERIFAANPGAFIDGDMDRLRAGSVLLIPVLDGAPATATTGPAATAPDAATPAAANGPAGTNAPADARRPTTADTGQSAGTGSSAAAPAARAAAPAVTAGDSAAAGASAGRIRPAVRQAMDEMAAGADTGGAAETPSPFKAADGGETAPDAALTPAGPAPDVAAAQPASRSSVSPLFAALFGAGIGLLMGLVIFRSSVREFFRRAPTPAAARGERPGAGTAAAAAAVSAAADTAAHEGTDVMPAPVFEPEEADVIVSEEEWDDATRSRLKSLDLDFGDEDEDDTLGEEVITEQQLAVARMEFPAGDDSETVPETEGAAVLPPEERIDESMIMEVDTGAELAAGKTAQEDAGQADAQTEDTGTLATVADLEMLEEDYEQEFTATQRLARQLADAAIALDREITAHGDDLDDSIAAGGDEDAEETVAATAQAGPADGAQQTGATAVMPREPDRDGDIIDEADQTAVLSADEATAVTPVDGEDEGDTVEHTGVYATATTRLPSADEPCADEPSSESDEDGDEDVGETAVVPLSEKRRA